MGLKNGDPRASQEAHESPLLRCHFADDGYAGDSSLGLCESDVLRDHDSRGDGGAVNGRRLLGRNRRLVGRESVESGRRRPETSASDGARAARLPPDVGSRGPGGRPDSGSAESR